MIRQVVTKHLNTVLAVSKSCWFFKIKKTYSAYRFSIAIWGKPSALYCSAQHIKIALQNQAG